MLTALSLHRILPRTRRRERNSLVQTTKYILAFFTTSTKMSSNSSSTPIPSPFVLKPKYVDFKKVQARRPKFNPSQPVHMTQPPCPSWKYGSGGTLFDTSSSTCQVEIDPHAKDRSMMSNYRLLVSGIPRPISFISTVSKAGAKNLAPFSYFQVVDHDPPTFVVGFSARPGRAKDTRRNLVDTGECVISIATENIVESVNATSLDIPYEDSEWPLSGLTPVPSSTVKPERVKEAVFSIEGKLLEMKQLNYHGKFSKGEDTAAMAIIEATRFWVKEEAINAEKSEIDLEKFRPVVQLGGMMYGRLAATFELPRPALVSELADGSNGLKDILDKSKKILVQGLESSSL